MIIKNPLNKQVTIGISGVEYSIDANNTRDLPESIALQWQKVHGFLQIVQEEVKETKEELPTVKEEVNEVKETKKIINKVTKK